MKNYLDELSPAQRSAAANIEGPALIIAGAGSGKTRTLTYRIAHLIDSGVWPRNILALTFTNKAAREMRERMEQVLPPSALRGLWMGTFHGVFRRILTAEAKLLGFPENFTIYETADSRNLIKSVIHELQLPDERYKPKDVFGRISLAKNSLITPAAYEANATARSEDEEAKRPELYRIYARYTQRCKLNGAMDFDDMLLQMNYLLRDHPEVAAKYGEMFRYIMVDEYQDTNFSQYLIVKKLAAIHRNICVVGDDSQSIYSFRGARIENILRFQKDFPEAKVYKLEQNYRSTKTIVEASNSLILHNSQRLEKTLYSQGEIGDKIRVVEAYNEKDEAARVADDIFRTIYSEGAQPMDFAILYRTNMQSRAFEEQLRQRSIPYRIYGGQSFYQRAEIKDMLSYLRLAINPNDDEALKRIINVPARGIGETSVSRIEGVALAKGISMFDALRSMSPADMGVRGPAVRGIEAFVNSFGSFAQAAPTADAYEFANEVAQKSGLLAFYRASTAVEDKSRLDNLEELLNSIKSFTMPEQMGDVTEEVLDESGDGRSFTIGDWLAEVSLLTDMDENADEQKDEVTMLTVHSSKGLEFKYIYVVGMVEELFPSCKPSSGDTEVEEERRLFYVALTRARVKATLSFMCSRFKWGEMVDCDQSRFISEIDQEHLDMQVSGGGGADRRAQFASVKSGFGSTPRFGAQRRAYPSPNAQRGQGASGSYSNEVPSRKDDFVSSASRSVGAGSSPSSLSAPSPIPNPASLKKLASTVGTKVAAAGDLKEGSRVSHARFGAGEVVSIEQTATDLKLTVNFDGAGEKVLLQKFANLTLL